MNSANENQQPLSTQGNANEKEEQLGGTTNLSLDQLKKEGDTSNPGEDNPNNIENPDDLHEIRVDDDLGEPDADQQKSAAGSGQTNVQDDEIASGSTQDEVIPPPDDLTGAP
jgi:hypothetical protein